MYESYGYAGSWFALTVSQGIAPKFSRRRLPIISAYDVAEGVLVLIGCRRYGSRPACIISGL
jgi:hypothetical protein